jgi:hypothetical protein
MLFECPRCHYSTQSKSHFIEHLNRKVPCEAEFADTSIRQLREQYYVKEVSKNHKCLDCGKSFSHQSGLYRHRKVHIDNHSEIHTNSHNDTTNNTNINTHSHNQTNTHHDHSVTNNTTNNTNSHNQTNYNIDAVNVTMNLFGKETTEHVEQDNEFMTKCLKEILQAGIPNLIEKIYFNKDVPENNNVKLKREHYPKKMLVFTQEEGSKPYWKEEDLDFIVDKMIDKGRTLLVKHNDKLYRFEEIDKIEDDELRALTIDRYDLRQTRFDAVKSRRKGVYGPIKSGVVSRARSARGNTSNTDN